MTAQDILNKIDELQISNREFAYADWEEEFDAFVGQHKRVSRWGGEGEGENIGYVYHFSEHDVYLRIDGYYQSHYGSEWDNAPYEVRPKEKIIIVYE